MAKTVKNQKTKSAGEMDKVYLKELISNLLKENSIKFVDCEKNRLERTTKDTLVALRLPNGADVQIKLICPVKSEENPNQIYIEEEDIEELVA